MYCYFSFILNSHARQVILSMPNFTSSEILGPVYTMAYDKLKTKSIGEVTIPVEYFFMSNNLRTGHFILRLIAHD